MQPWFRDQNSRLVRRNLDSIIFTHTNTQISNIANNKSMHNENQIFGNQENRGMRTLHKFLEPTRTTTLSCMIFPTNVGHFDLKPGIS